MRAQPLFRTPGAASYAAAPRPALAEDYVPPGTDAEVRIAAMWSGLLGVDRIGVRDNFFELGGHSLLAIQLLSRVREAFGIEVPLQALFDGPTVGEFAAAVSQAAGLAAEERATVAALLDLVEQLPDEEVARLLARAGPGDRAADASFLAVVPLTIPAKERTRQFYDDVKRG